MGRGGAEQGGEKTSLAVCWLRTCCPGGHVLMLVRCMALRSVHCVVRHAAPSGPQTLTSGIVSGLNRELSNGGMTIKGLVQTDAAINPGGRGSSRGSGF